MEAFHRIYHLRRLPRLVARRRREAIKLCVSAPPREFLSVHSLEPPPLLQNTHHIPPKDLPNLNLAESAP